MYNRIAGQSLERISALSDGVFAIAMTLIVLEIRVPEHPAVQTESELLNAVGALAPRLVMYLMSFLTLGIFWVGQQTQLSLLSRSNRDLAWIHLAFLACVVLFPFSTTLLAEHITFRTALALYWLNVLLSGWILYIAWGYSVRHELTSDEVDAGMTKAIRRRILIAQGLYALGVGLSVINTYWSIGFIVLVQLNYAFAPKIKGLYGA